MFQHRVTRLRNLLLKILFILLGFENLLKKRKVSKIIILGIKQMHFFFINF